MLSTFTSQPPQLLSAAQLVDEMAAGSSGSGVTSFCTAASNNTVAAATSSSTAAVSLDTSCDPASQLGKSCIIPLNLQGVSREMSFLKLKK